MGTSIIAASGGDFTTLSAWEASLPSTLIEEEIAQIRGVVTETTFFQPDVVTTPTFRLLIEAEAGEETTYDEADTKAKLVYTLSDAHRYRSGTSKDVLFRSIALHNNDKFFFNDGSEPNNIIYKDVFFFGTDQQTVINQLVNNSVIDVSLTNCLIIGYNQVGASKSAIWENVTAIHANPSRVNTDTGLQDELPLRCYTAGFDSAFGDYFPSGNGTDNAAHDTTADLVDNASLTDQYTDPTNYDWTFKSGNVLEGAATAGADIGFVLPSAAVAGRIMSSLVGAGGLVGYGGIAGKGGGLAG